MPWSFRYDVDAVQSIYALPRVVAGDVTAATRALAQNSRPENAEPIPGREKMYRLALDRHFVDYELNDQEQNIKILFIG